LFLLVSPVSNALRFGGAAAPIIIYRNEYRPPESDGGDPRDDCRRARRVTAIFGHVRDWLKIKRPTVSGVRYFVRFSTFPVLVAEPTLALYNIGDVYFNRVCAVAFPTICVPFADFGACTSLR